MTYSSATAVVTGAASGMGRALVTRLLAQGARVYAVDRDAAGLDALEPFGTGRLTTITADVSQRAAVAEFIDRAAAESGRLDYLFNNAGIVVGGDFAEMTEDAWEKIVGVNFWGVVHGTQLGYARMRKLGGGHIVNTASSAGVMPVARSAAYAATKHAVVGLSTSLRVEAAEFGIRVSVVLPGVVDTGIFDSAVNLRGYDYRASIDKLPFAKVRPIDAADAILHGVSKNKQFITFPAYNRIIIGLNRMLPNVMAPIINRGGRK
ncbi:SDR family oxidoreductase [Nocardia yamanashiensis]|uniref:SDR family NAD(P)-dependent oxidoreductase n=1 Tax=Nocardia yamanashiensis TaxID=209247 RepID=UPI00082D8926|nr:SDR family oxidoreductase [Nocardia yamanashiensis]UGT42254.1 SDR family oxidoreductase [Nocardia yamanashiensis]